MRGIEELTQEARNRALILAPFHEAGHAVATLQTGIKLIQVDLFDGGVDKVGNTKIEPPSVIYYKKPPIPVSLNEALQEFEKRNFQLMCGPAAQANFLYVNGSTNPDGKKSFAPEEWTNFLSLVENQETFDVNQQMNQNIQHFIAATSAFGDWKEIMSNIATLPYWFAAKTESHEARQKYISELWLESVQFVKLSWQSISALAAELEIKKQLTGSDVERIVKQFRHLKVEL